jgi:hypothetical protein
MTRSFTSYVLIPAVATVALVLGAQNLAWAKQGFDTETDTTVTQGNSGKPAKDNNNEGTKTETTTTTGPKGALQNDKVTPNQETTTTSSGPGKGNQ